VNASIQFLAASLLTTGVGAAMIRIGARNGMLTVRGEGHRCPSCGRRVEGRHCARCGLR
jgi:hypothetical protein